MKFKLAEKPRANHTAGVITELGIGNFKAFGETQRVPIKPLTLIFGANSSGKSSIIHSVLLANHALQTDNWDVHHPNLGLNAADLGGYPNYVHRQRATTAVTLSIQVSAKTQFLTKFLYGTEAEKAPFAALSSFGLKLEVARQRAPKDPQDQPPLLAVQAVSFDLNHCPALRFERTGPDAFRCCETHTDNLFIRDLLLAMLSQADKHDEKEARDPRAFAEQTQCSVRRSADLSEPERLAVLARAFTTIVRERSFESRRGESPFEELAVLAESCGDDPRVPGASYMEEQIQMYRSLTELCKDQYGPSLFDEFSDAVAREREDPEVVQRVTKARREAERRDETMLDLEAPAQAARINLSRLLEFVTLQVSLLLKRVSYVGPLRQAPGRHPGAEWPVMLQAPAAELGAWKEVCENDQVRQTVNRWLGKGCLQTPYTLGVRRLNDPENPLAEPLLEPFFRDAAGTFLNHHDLGFGVSQVLPVLVHAAARTKRTICVEQPELHLHPAHQAELGDVFIESALGEPKNTFLLETHSEHLILRIMRRMRETYEKRLPGGLPPVRPEDVSIVYVERDGASSIVREMPLNEQGELVKAWPGGFFEEGFRELFS